MDNFNREAWYKSVSILFMVQRLSKEILAVQFLSRDNLKMYFGVPSIQLYSRLLYWPEKVVALLLIICVEKGVFLTNFQTYCRFSFLYLFSSKRWFRKPLQPNSYLSKFMILWILDPVRKTTLKSWNLHDD